MAGEGVNRVSERDIELHVARVLLAEAMRRRHQPFSFVLLEWAGNARRRALACHVQRRLFA